MPLKDSDGRILEEIRSRELSTLSDKEFLHGLQLQERENEDAKDFGPYWLDGVQGSLAEERRQSKSDKTKFYNAQVSKARRELRRLRLDLRSLLSDPESWNIKLSQLWSRYPSLRRLEPAIRYSRGYIDSKGASLVRLPLVSDVDVWVLRNGAL